MARKRNNRKKTFVDRNVQGALVRRLVFHWLVFLLVGTAVTLVFQYLTDPFTSMDEHFSSFLQKQSGFIAVMLCMTPIFVLDTVKLSHRFAGPILRLRRGLRELAAGEDAQRMTLRPGDFWTDLAVEFNAIVDRQQLTSHANAAPTAAVRAVEEAFN